MTSPAPANRNAARIPWLGLLLVLITLAVYAPVRHHEFINYDDPDYVTSNPRTQAGLTMAGIKWAFTEKHSSNWHPLTWISHMLDCQLFGLQPAGPHLVNAALHAANVLLLLQLLIRLTGARWRSALVAGLFALHPLHVESVAWVSERKDVLSTFFFLLTLLAYARYAGAANNLNSKSKLWYGLALLWFALGLLAKPMLVTVPCVLLLLDFWPLQRLPLQAGEAFLKRLRPLVVEKIPFFILTLTVSVITVIVQRDSGATVPLSALAIGPRLAQMPVAYVRYLGKTFWPDDLAVLYPYVTMTWSSVAVIGAAMLIVALTVAAMREIRSRPYLFAGWCWFLGTLVPVIGLVQVGRQAIADRYTYIPHIGLFVALVWLLAELLDRAKIPRAAQATGAALLLGACGVLTAQQLRHWQSTGTLARQTIRATKDNYVAQAHLAGALMAEGKLTEAVAACQESLRLNPAFPEAHNILATLYVRLDQPEQAIASYREAIRHDGNYPEPHHGLAGLFIKLARYPEAEAESRAALRISPLHFPSLYTLAQSLHSQNRLDEAMQVYQQLDALRPGLFSSHYGLGSIHVLKGRVTEALREFQIALSIQPTNAAVHNSLGTLLLDGGKVMEASNHFATAATLEPTNVIANAQLAALLVAARQDERAAKHYRIALQSGTEQSDGLNNFAWLLATSWDDRVRNGAEAVKLADRACALTGQRMPVFIGTLAAAYAEAGRFEDAVAAATRARDLAREQKLDAVAARNEELLQQYRAGKAYHEPKP